MLKKLLILSVFSFSVFSQAKPALIEMIQKGSSVQEIQEAIEQGADVNPKAGFFSKKQSTLITAIKNKRPEVAKLLVSYGADVDGRNKYEQTALMLASYYGYSDLARALLQAGADANAKSGYEQTALMLAVQVENLEMVRLLLEAGADVNARDKDGNPALLYNGHLQIVKALLQAGAFVNAKNINGQTALMIASYYGYSDVARVLLQHGAKVNLKDKDGQTALTYAYIEYGRGSIVKKDYQGTVQALKQAGATE